MFVIISFTNDFFTHFVVAITNFEIKLVDIVTTSKSPTKDDNNNTITPTDSSQLDNAINEHG